MNQNDKISHIEPKKKWLDVDLRGLWRYRDLYYMYIKRDIVTQYKQTILGPLWYIIQPLLTTIMYMFVFGGLAGISTDGIPQPLFYMAGITMWNYFSTCFTSCSEVFSHNANVFGKVYFPRLVVPLSSCTSNLIRMLIQLLMFIAIYIYYIATGQFAATLSFSVMLFPLFILMTGLHAMSWGLLFSSWTTKYRDLKFLISFGIQLLMYATPVIYPLSFAPERYRFILELNPLTPIFEAFKYSCLGTGTFSFIGLIYSLIFLCVTMFFSVIIFNRTEQRFMDTV
jgi:lipopolysaccharide transport system permease protein